MGWLLRTGAPDGLEDASRQSLDVRATGDFLPALCQQSFLEEEEAAWSGARIPGKERGRADGQS